MNCYFPKIYVLYIRVKGRCVLISFLMLITSYIARGQDRVFVLNLDSLDIHSDFDCTHYTLSTETLYPVSQKVHLYNLLPKSKRHRSEILRYLTRSMVRIPSVGTEILDLQTT